MRRGPGLRAIAVAIDAEAADLIAIANEETALGTPRLTGELAPPPRCDFFPT